MALEGQAGARKRAPRETRAGGGEGAGVRAALEAAPPSPLVALLAAAREAGARALAAYRAGGGRDPAAGLGELRQAQWAALEAAGPRLLADGQSPMLPALAAWRLLSDEPWRCPSHRWAQGERLCREWDGITGRRGAGAAELMWEVVDHLTPRPADYGRPQRCIGARLINGEPLGGDRDGGRPRSLAYFVILLKRRVRTARGRQAKAGACC